MRKNDKSVEKIVGLEKAFVWFSEKKLRKEKNEENIVLINEFIEIKEEKIKQFESDNSKKNIKLRYRILSTLFGFIFILRLLEMKELKITDKYVSDNSIFQKNDKEKAFIESLHDEKSKYISSIVLGLNDALVEMTGALAGYTLALSNTRVIAAVGLITGISASLSMAASEFLSAKHGKDKNPIKSAIYTGISYVISVTLLVIPYFVFDNAYIALGVMLVLVVLVILVFNIYASISKKESFIKNFLTMIVIAFVVAGISFLIGFLINKYFNIDI